MTAPTRDGILSDLYGQEVRVPDLSQVFAEWPSHVNHIQDASLVQKIIEEHTTTEMVRAKLQRENQPLLVASLYPFASRENLEILTHFFCWMYAVDDEIIDASADHGDTSLFDISYSELRSFIRKSLKLDADTEYDQRALDTFSMPKFSCIGDALCRKYSPMQRRRFYESFIFTMDGYQVENHLRIAGEMPPWDVYWRYRQGSCCIQMCIAMIELAINSEIPEEVMNSEEMQRLRTAATVICWLTNDIHSLKKEIRGGFVENAVVLRAIDTGSLQEGMDYTMRLLQESVAGFEDAAREVQAKFCSSDVDKSAVEGKNTEVGRSVVGKTVEEFVKSCRYMITGFVSWGSQSSRYGLSSLPRDPDGARVFIAGE